MAADMIPLKAILIGQILRAAMRRNMLQCGWSEEIELKNFDWFLVGLFLSSINIIISILITKEIVSLTTKH